MPIVDAPGLFDGDRINLCSVDAQLYYPRFLCCSNAFGRIRIDYVSIIAKAFSRWKPESRPMEDKVMSMLTEYVDNRLLFVYKSCGEIWGQWDFKKGTFGKYQTTEDHRSPEPPKSEYLQWIEQNRELSKKVSEPCGNFAEILRENSRNFSEDFPHGVGVGIGIRCEVLGVGEKKCAADAPPSQESIPGLPTSPEKQESTKKRSTKKSGEPDTDPRYHDFLQLINQYYVHKTGKGMKCKEPDFSNYKTFLRDYRDATAEDMQRWLNNRAKSPVNHSKPMREWICKLPLYEAGPLDKFYEPLTGGNNGKHQNTTSRTEQRVIATHENLLAALRIRVANDPTITSANGSGPVGVSDSGSSGVSVSDADRGIDVVGGEAEILPPDKSTVRR